MSASELEQAAMEAGIDPRFVRRAISETKQTSAAPRASTLPLYILGAFLFAQMFTISGTLQGKQVFLYIPFTLALFMGIAWSQSTRERGVAYGFLLVWSALVFGFLSLIGRHLFIDMGPEFVTRIVALQAFLILSGQGLSIISKKMTRKLASSPQVEA